MDINSHSYKIMIKISILDHFILFLQKEGSLSIGLSKTPDFNAHYHMANESSVVGKHLND